MVHNVVMKLLVFFILAIIILPLSFGAGQQPIEIHDQLVSQPESIIHHEDCSDA
jgi:hypothetical protein